ncbi:polysaccharide deacetylase family protein [uncultured Nitrospira sp.]|uniref:polysaccharide deacetylase family protein n=1 Tax=uncultured Nitrospira sp. TaxID=157176 RepID=UPI003140978A
MIIRHFKRSVEKNRNELLGLGLGRYPAFVRVDVSPEQIPVFQFHEVSTATLEPVLAFMANNEYSTLTGDEYYERIVGASPRRDREVMLTFDDGYASLYAVAFPILQKFKQKAVAYIVPGRIPEGEINSNENDMDRALCSWLQIREMHDSGVIDFQSHSLYHHSIAISPKICDFNRPGLSTSFLQSDLAPMRYRHMDGPDPDLRCPWGLPIYQWNARMCGSPAYIPNTQAEDLCIRYVAENGGEAFFDARGWWRQLLQIMTSGQEKYVPRQFETPERQRNAMLTDLRQSKTAIESRLPGSRVRHFCFPWYRGSALAVEISHEAGYVSNAWGSLLPKYVNNDDRQPVPIPRLPPRYIHRLPGDGRKPLWKLFGGAA